MRIIRWIGLTLLAVAIGGGVLGLWMTAKYRGWMVESLAPLALAETLRPAYRIMAPEGEGPFPAGILVSGCDGVHDNMTRWGDMLVEAGWAAIIVDSHTPRDLNDEPQWRPICRGQRFWGSERAADVLIALDDARRNPLVDPDRIVLIGSSHGAWSIMELLVFDPPRGLPFALADQPETVADRGLGGVSGVVLLYPYCGFGNRARANGWPHEAPVLLVLAGEDTLASPDACRDIADRLGERGIDVAVEEIPGVTHGFDQQEREPGSQLRFDPEATRQVLQMGRAFLDPLSRKP